VEVQLGQGAAPTKPAIRVVVRPTQYVQQMQASLAPGAPVPQTKPLVDGLVVVPALDTPRTIRTFTDKDGASLGLNPNQVHALAIANLRTTLKPLMEIDASDEEPACARRNDRGKRPDPKDRRRRVRPGDTSVSQA
jgi:hypothetical protein